MQHGKIITQGAMMQHIYAESTWFYTGRWWTFYHVLKRFFSVFHVVNVFFLIFFLRRFNIDASECRWPRPVPSHILLGEQRHVWVNNVLSRDDQTVNQTGDLQQRPSCTCCVLKRHRLIYDSRRKKNHRMPTFSIGSHRSNRSRCRPTHNVLSRADNTSRQSKKRTPLFIKRYETLGSRVVSVLDSGAEGPGSNRSRDAVGWQS